MIRWAGRAIAAWFTSRADLIAENLCLRQQLIVLQRRMPRPRLRAGDRRFWILACRWVPRWRESLLVVQPATVLGWHPPGVDGIVAMALPARKARRAAPYRGSAARPHPEDGRRESPVGTTPRPGRACGAGVYGIGADCRHVYAGGPTAASLRPGGGSF